MRSQTGCKSINHKITPSTPPAREMGASAQIHVRQPVGRYTPVPVAGAPSPNNATASILGLSKDMECGSVLVWWGRETCRHTCLSFPQPVGAGRPVAEWCQFAWCKFGSDGEHLARSTPTCQVGIACIRLPVGKSACESLYRRRTSIWKLVCQALLCASVLVQTRPSIALLELRIASCSTLSNRGW